MYELPPLLHIQLDGEGVSNSTLGRACGDRPTARSGNLRPRHPEDGQEGNRDQTTKNFLLHNINELQLLYDPHLLRTRVTLESVTILIVSYKIQPVNTL